MTELATRPFATDMLPTNGWDGTLARTAPMQVPKGERLREWLDLFIKTEQVANVLAKTQFVPKAMQGKPAEVAAAMMRSFEMSIDPLDGLGHMHVINGKVGYSAELMRRRIIEAGHEIIFVEATDSRAVIKGRRREHADDETKWQTVVFTEDNARKAKIDLGAYPADKLVARASSRMCRRVFPEVLAGAAIAEDLIDAVVIEGGDAAALADLPDEMRPALPARGRASSSVQRKRQPRAAKAAAPAGAPAPSGSDLDDLLDEPAEPATVVSESRPEPEPAQVSEGDLVDDADGYDTPDPSDEPAVTKPQLQKLSILRQREKYDDTDDGRADWFAWVQLNIGRLVGSNKDLTKAEASVLIDILENDPTTTGQEN